MKCHAFCTHSLSYKQCLSYLRSLSMKGVSLYRLKVILTKNNTYTQHNIVNNTIYPFRRRVCWVLKEQRDTNDNLIFLGLKQSSSSKYERKLAIYWRTTSLLVTQWLECSVTQIYSIIRIFEYHYPTIQYSNTNIMFLQKEYIRYLYSVI
jgi:hypothetical protein